MRLNLRIFRLCRVCRSVVASSYLRLIVLLVVVVVVAGAPPFWLFFR